MRRISRAKNPPAKPEFPDVTRELLGVVHACAGLSASHIHLDIFHHDDPDIPDDCEMRARIGGGLERLAILEADEGRWCMEEIWSSMSESAIPYDPREWRVTDVKRSLLPEGVGNIRVISGPSGRNAYTRQEDSDLRFMTLKFDYDPFPD